ncbi:Protein of unknown function [Gryllus bimaculatus]|nr:Protein of unknown function [Gryllus bimaculatus]
MPYDGLSVQPLQLGNTSDITKDCDSWGGNDGGLQVTHKIDKCSSVANVRVVRFVQWRIGGLVTPKILAYINYELYIIKMGLKATKYHMSAMETCCNWIIVDVQIHRKN